MDQIGRLEKIQYSTAKEGGVIEVMEVKVHPALGIAEDYHSTQGDAKLTIWETETRKKLEKEGFEGLCFRRFKEHLSISGLDLSSLEVGSSLRIDKVDFRVVQKGKGCHPECRVKLSGVTCPLGIGILYAEAINEGVIKQGDRVFI